MKVRDFQNSRGYRGLLLGSVLTLAFAFPTWANEYFHPHKGPDSGHHGMGYSGHGHHEKGYSGHGSKHHGTSHHGTGYKKHGKSHHGKKHGHGKGYGIGGPHQNASDFIHHILKFKQGMAITDEQASRLKSIEISYKKTRIKMKAEVELANIDLHELLKKEDSSLSDIETHLKNVHTLKADMLMASIKAKREAKSVLTQEQRDRMKAVHERIKAHGSKMRKPGHAGGYTPGKSSHKGKGTY